MKLLTFLLTSLFGQDSFLVKQGGVEVPLSDLDAYVYLIHEDRRGDFAVKHDQIEKNIFTLLNINIVYQYVLDSELNELDQFKAVVKGVNESEWLPDEHFIEQLELNPEVMKSSVRSYVIKREFYKTMLAYLDETTTEEQLKNALLEYYMVNKSEFMVPEKRDISVIMMDATKAADAQSLLETLADSSQQAFENQAIQISEDPSVSLNKGHWGEFKSNQFNYAFKSEVFSANLGVIPEVLKDQGKAYIIRVNEITPAHQGRFEDAKAEIFKKLKSKTVMRKFQNIINEKAVDEVEVNPELVAHVFERYKVFNED